MCLAGTATASAPAPLLRRAQFKFCPRKENVCFCNDAGVWEEARHQISWSTVEIGISITSCTSSLHGQSTTIENAHKIHIVVPCRCRGGILHHLSLFEELPAVKTTGLYVAAVINHRKVPNSQTESANFLHLRYLLKHWDFFEAQSKTVSGCTQAFCICKDLGCWPF